MLYWSLCSKKLRNNLGNGQMQNYASIRKSAKEEWGAFVVCQNLPYISSSTSTYMYCVLYGHLLDITTSFFPHNPRKCNRGLLGPPTPHRLRKGMKEEEVMMYLTFWLRLLLGLFSLYSFLPYSHQDGTKRLNQCCRCTSSSIKTLFPFFLRPRSKRWAVFYVYPQIQSVPIQFPWLTKDFCWEICTSTPLRPNL